MVLRSRGLGFWIPKPKTFLGLMSLQTGTEMIALITLINKVPGVYGFLTILTGYSVSAVQVSMYLYSVCALVTLALLVPHIRRRSAFQSLALAWFYILDTLVNTAYTSTFATFWYLASLSSSGPVYTPTGPAGQNSVSDSAAGSTGDAAAQAQDTAGSMVLIVALSVTRLYFILVVAAFARQALLRHVEVGGGSLDDDDGRPQLFVEGTPEGEGWRGKLGRTMISFGRDYWVGSNRDEEWTEDVTSKLRSRGHGAGLDDH
ncbi:putative duf1753-domain-containing protein [Phaeoacremonium minimum UCRPA7]|uniref:Putative duf1753-domain-containing protein n=1 Tax=Phaeoacremonium minimum (strain UCR-PA7) TaxID=1286976 RepID=R8BWW0_PHAM7|nr:putative duf1753-domain-containing protein [Phaeoacremonium minimum UCRPA7]EOO03846.1 putative duf1753-domain-containing protein [Phaeoacremonium minimum UCRPA7]